MSKTLEERVSDLEAIVGEVLQYMDDQDDLSLQAMHNESVMELRERAQQLRKRRDA